MRPRNTLLASLHLFKTLDPRVSVNEIMAFLHVCENEGLTVQELADAGRLTQSTASRSLRALGPADSEWSLQPALGLVRAYLHPNDGRSHVVQLTERGLDLRERLDGLIRGAEPIVQERAAA
jgi:DNA-binding MarR family transcriptional regulator